MDIVGLQQLKEIFFRQEKHLIMNCAAFIVVTTSFLSWTDAISLYYNKGNAKAHWNHIGLIEV